MFCNVPVIFRQVLGNFRKSSDRGRKSSENRQKTPSSSSLALIHELSRYCYFFTAAPLSSYVKGRLEDKKCRYARCLCEMEMVRCMGHYKSEIDTTKIFHQQCNITGNKIHRVNENFQFNDDNNFASKLCFPISFFVIFSFLYFQSSVKFNRRQFTGIHSSTYLLCF